MFEAFKEEHYKDASAAQMFHELLSAISKVVNLAEYKDVNHAQRVAVYSLRLAESIGMSDPFELTQIYCAGLLHDIGEIGIPDFLLFRKGKLNEDEFQLLTTHTRLGKQIAEEIPFLKEGARIILWHHERYDGTGYPEGLCGRETPLEAQIVSLCDALDNIRRGGLFSEPAQWKQELTRFSAIQFNPNLVLPAIRLVESGALEKIELSEDEISLLKVIDEDKELSSQLKENFISIIVNFFGTLIEAKHKDSAAHSKRVSRLARRIGERMGLSELELDTLELAGFLHDIGKMGVPSSVLDKPGALTKEEFELVKKHPEYSAEILAPLLGFKEVAVAVKHHHEKWDGTGYPDGLARYDIPLFSRIVFLADVADALAHLPEVSADRAKREGARISDSYGSSFDPSLSRYYKEEMDLEWLEREA